jgi:hypothetical protein
VGLTGALTSGDVTDIARGFQKITTARKLSLFEVESISAIHGMGLMHFIGD